VLKDSVDDEDTNGEHAWMDLHTGYIFAKWLDMCYKTDKIVDSMKERIIKHNEVPNNDLRRIKDRYSLNIITKYLQRELKNVFKN
jgi:hypothetical protein